MKKPTQNSKGKQPEIFRIPEIDIFYKPKIKASDRPKITNPWKAYEILMQSWDHNRIELIEQCKVILIDRASRLLGVVDISTGGIDKTPVNVLVILAIARTTRANSIILAHNHPSGHPDPSLKDKESTTHIYRFCRLNNIQFKDHIIVCTNGYFSFADKGLL